MVSNLPLLFARGSPTSLESMCLEELQAFLRFVLKCEQNLSVVDLDTLARPPWWPGEAAWSEGLLARRKEGRGKASSSLRAAIKACYSYHDCVYLLEFCRKLITFTGGKENLQVIDNRDGTRSLLNKVSRKLLVTFKSENQDYDKLQFPQKSVASGDGIKNTHSSKPKQLVKSKSDNTSDPSLTKCVDVYLCDSCDKDFDRLSDLIQHEKTCGKEVVCMDEDRSAQAIFLGNVRLAKKGVEVTPTKLKESERPRAANYDKFMEIDVASPLGRYILTSSCLTIDQTNPATRGFKSQESYNDELEAKCPGTIRGLRSSNANMEIKNKWNNSYRFSKKKASAWTHSYTFTAAETELKMRILRDGLVPRSLRLYRKCRKKKAKTSLRRLSEETVREVMARYAKMDRMEMDMNSVPARTDPTEDRIIDELLCDNSEDEGVAASSEPKNDIVNFKNVGFRTSFESFEKGGGLASFIVHDEAYSSGGGAPQLHHALSGEEGGVKQEPHPPGRQFQVPRPLPELMKLCQARQGAKEVECVDLCSSDED